MVTNIDRFRLIDKVIRISNSTVNVELRLKNLLNVIGREMEVSRVFFFNLNPEAKTLTLRATDDQDRPPDLTLDAADHFLAETAIKQMPRIVSGRLPDDIPADARSLFAPYDTLAAFPVQDDQVLYGVLLLADRHECEYDESRMGLLETISREIAGTIRNSRLYAESKKRIAELSVLYEVGRAVSSTLELKKILDTVVTITSKVLLAEGCALSVLDKTTGALAVSAEHGIIPEGYRLENLIDPVDGRLLPHARPCLARQTPFMGPAAKDPSYPGDINACPDESLICLPLIFKGPHQGTLSVYNKLVLTPGQQRGFSREDMELLKTMGTMIASSLENALSFQEADDLARRNERLVRSLRCLYDISSAMMTTVKLDELLSIITRALTSGQALWFDRALVYLMSEEEDALIGAALRAITPEERAAQKDLPLADILRTGDAVTGESHDGESAFIGSRLPLDPPNHLVVKTALEQRAYTVKPGDAGYHSSDAWPFEFGTYFVTTVPLLAKGKVVGVIAVDRFLPGTETTEENLRNLSMLANQAGLSVENSRLYEYIEQANQALSQTRARLIEAEKLAALGELAAGMAHEIRNPLVSIGGFTRRLLKNMAEDSPQRTYVEVVINEVTRLEKTLGEVLDFSQDSLGHYEEHNLNDIVEDALHILRMEFRQDDIYVHRDLTDVPMVLVDEAQIKHVLFNLFFNACQAMDSGGGLTVSTYATQLEDRAYAAVAVSDTGPGISPDVLPNIFNPFFTTKDAGTGLGLSIVHKIISRHHGIIEVLNREDDGAMFIIQLPVAAEAGLYLK